MVLRSARVKCKRASRSLSVNRKGLTNSPAPAQAPQLDINTVAAGGGSRLFFRSGVFQVRAGRFPAPPARIILVSALLCSAPYSTLPKAGSWQRFSCEQCRVAATARAFLPALLLGTALPGPTEGLSLAQAAPACQARPPVLLTAGKLLRLAIPALKSRTSPSACAGCPCSHFLGCELAAPLHPAPPLPSFPQVGPESAGAHPGPVCYRKGGYPAVTDANLVLGRILPAFFPHIFGPAEDEPLDEAGAR